MAIHTLNYQQVIKEINRIDKIPTLSRTNTNRATLNQLIKRQAQLRAEKDMNVASSQSSRGIKSLWGLIGGKTRRGRGSRRRSRRSCRTRRR